MLPAPMPQSNTCKHGTVFNGAPHPWGVNATVISVIFWSKKDFFAPFQWATQPLGVNATFFYVVEHVKVRWDTGFNGAPTLGGECYAYVGVREIYCIASFNGHPPLGVNATVVVLWCTARRGHRFNGHPPLGVNATASRLATRRDNCQPVSMGTHPWG